MNKSQEREIVQKDRQKTLAEQYITHKSLAEKDNQHANIKKNSRNYSMEFKTRGQKVKTKKESCSCRQIKELTQSFLYSRKKLKVRFYHFSL